MLDIVQTRSRSPHVSPFFTSQTVRSFYTCKKVDIRYVSSFNMYNISNNAAILKFTDSISDMCV